MKPRRTTTYRNRLGLPVILVVIVIVASLAFAGLGIVVGKNRVRALGEEQRKIEDEIRLLRSEIVKLEQSREKAFTSARVQPRLTRTATMLKDLDEGRILFFLPPQAVTPVVTSTNAVPAAIPVARAVAQASSQP